MRPLRFRFLLPLIFGCLATALIAWEFHNERVIEAVGMGWDTGPPIWPYQSSWLLLQAINAPAYVLDLPFFALLGVRSNQPRLLLEWPTIVLWWWFIGWRIDVGLLPCRNVRLRGLWVTVFVIASMTFWACTIYLILEQVRFWSEYGELGWRGPILFLIRHVGILCWCILLGFWSTAITLRFTTSSPKKSQSITAE
jgi:hypothetical protein